jgi:4-amino-4-deoxy-L-arabinose transferase-like glycosyltransferase
MKHIELSAALHRISSLFVVGSARERGTAWEKRALLALLVLAAIVRLWGLGSYGLHKPDEDTTALPAVHILLDGTPRFPSGMLYTRAMVQSYLIAASAMSFGQTEWALRLPSVLCGLLLVVLAYIVGRRFLEPGWNIVFVAVIAFLPGMIADSQEVRMYIFLLASLAAYTAFIFKWERTDRTAYLVAAVGTMLLGIQFHQLAIFGSLVIFFPGLAQGDTKKLQRAAIAYLPIALYFVYVRWTPSPYPLPIDYAPGIPMLGQAPATLGLRFQPIISGAAVLVGGLIAWLLARHVTRARSAVTVGALLLIGFVALAGLHYHIAVLCLLLGVILARRNGKVRWTGLAALGAAVLAVAVIQVLMLHGAGAGSLRKIIGILSGRPSIWPYLVAAGYSPVATAITIVALGAAILRLARRQPVPDFWLFFLLGVWAPLFALGCTGWYFPPRYTEFVLLPLFLTSVAAAQRLVAMSAVTMSPRQAKLGASIAWAICAVAIVNPIAMARAVNPGASFPDHRGAAAYMRSIKLGPKDVVLAEEVLLQTYYLGHVDYWLVNRNVAASFVELWQGRIVDQYTHTPVIGSGAELRALLDKPDRGAIYVIGSGESQEDGRRFMRGDEIFELLQSDEFKVVYVARDKLTKVWKVDAPAGGAQ